MDFNAYLREGQEARSKISHNEVTKLAEKILHSLLNGGKLLVFGNGGSAADSQHFAAELSGRFMRERKPLAAVALSTNTSSLTAIGNDYSFEDIFDRQVRSLASKNDVVVGISTSGNSPNVLRAIESANSIGCYTYGLTGHKGGKLAERAAGSFRAESDLTPIIQETHIAFIHLVCWSIDDLLEKTEK